MSSFASFINHCFKSLSLPVAFAILVLVCFGLGLAGAAVAFLALNGALPPNLVVVTAFASTVASVPMILQSMPTIRHLQGSRQRLKEARYDLIDSVAELDAATRGLDEARADLENRVERRTRELEAMRRAAEEGSQAKSAFLAQMGHELRTPLNAIIGFSELMMEPASTSPAEKLMQVEEYSDIVNRSGKHLLSLVNDLLDISKIEAGKIDLHIDLIDPATLLSDMEGMTGPLLREKGQTLTCLLDPDTGALEADPRAMRQILLNLLSNAVKYSPPDTTITMSCTGAGDQVAFTIRDEGQGMTPDEIMRAMKPFERLSNAQTQGESGTGLGLYIVASLIEAQGGTLALASEPGTGTEAQVSLPRRIVAKRSAPPPRAIRMRKTKTAVA